MESTATSSYTPLQRMGLILGPLTFLIIQLWFRPQGLPMAAVSVLAATAWVGWWWVTEAVPMAATGLIPIVLLPLLGALPIRTTTEAYAAPMIFLFLGGFVLALAMEKWNLHRRIALAILSRVGHHSRQIVLGFMIATGFLSMWISNTATTVMMLPIGMAVIGQMAAADGGGNHTTAFGKALMLGIAYSASIGGMATLVGTPTNPILSDIIQTTYGVELSFAAWMGLGLPVTILLIGFSWWYITHVAFRLTHSVAGGLDFGAQRKALGPMKYEEWVVLGVFMAVAVAWIAGPLLRQLVPGLSDTSIAIAGAIALFVWPGADPGCGRVMGWEDTRKLPWEVLILFGGGLCIARGFTHTGLADWIGNQLVVLDAVPLFVIILLIVALVNFLTEVTSNVATASMILPVLATLAAVLGVHPLALMVGATLAASCAFMLPVATAPNAVVFGSHLLRIPDMVRVGFALNLISILLISLAVYFLMPLIWGISLLQALPPQ